MLYYSSAKEVKVAIAVNDEIKHQIKIQLAKKRMTQKQLAEVTGIHEVQLSRMMSKEDVGTVERWKAILEAVDLELNVKEKK
jgi:DNA-binding Xre family transcriptional regulator